jgi:hypothetical protein
MKINVEIDEFTPCLIERSTGKIVKTRYKHINKEEVPEEWQFNWKKPFDVKDCEILALYLEDTNEIQGLVAYMPKKENHSVYVVNVEVAPHNYRHVGKYKGTGAHLFAIAIKKSMELGFEGHIHFNAKTNIIEHYEKTIGARLVNAKNGMMEVSEQDAKDVYEKYMEGSFLDE